VTQTVYLYLVITIELTFNALPSFANNKFVLRTSNALAMALLRLALTLCLSAVVFNVVMLHLGTNALFICCTLCR
jgi:hypothetical protein